MPSDSGVEVIHLLGGPLRFSFYSVWSNDPVHLSMAAASGRLTAGVYNEAYPRQETGFPYLDINQCEEVAGRFRVYEATYDSTDRLLTFAADFEAHCSAGSAVPFVAGAIRYNATRTTVRPFDGAYPAYSLTIAPAPTGRVIAHGLDCGLTAYTDCSESYAAVTTVMLRAIPMHGYRFAAWTGACDGGPSTTVSVTWVKTCAAIFTAVPFTNAPDDPRLAAASFFIDSRQGDPLGSGRRHLWLGPRIRAWSWLDRNVVSLSVNVPEATFAWRVDFRAPGTTVLQPGLYEGATGTIFGTSTAPGLSVSAPHGSCTIFPSIGRFVVYEIGMASNNIDLLSFAADFEFRCSASSPPLFASIRFNSSRPELRPFATPKPPADITGDSWPDVLFQNRADGRLLGWGMNRGMKTGEVAISPSVVSDPMWHVVGTGDANRDGQMDLYWHHQTTGDLAIWFMSGPSQIAAHWISPTPLSDTLWQVRAVADMDRDGYPDLVWQHEGTGGLAVWYMTGRERRINEFIVPGAVTDANWHLAAAADVDGDDYPDFFWHNSLTGQVVVWYMQGHTMIAHQWLSPDRLSDTSWRLRGAVDLDRNGYPDLIWQNTTTFEIGAWLLEGVNVIGGQWIGPPLPSADWRLVSPR